MARRLLFLLIWGLLWERFEAKVALKDFFPYGLANGDKEMEKTLDGSTERQNLNVTFPFFSYRHSSLWVNVNGAFSFVRPVAMFTPVCTAVRDDYRMIAPYWSDNDIRRGGNVYYRESMSASVLNKAHAEITAAFPLFGFLRFNWAFVASWINVPYYAGRCNTSETFNGNTFQAILVTDGTYSFAIFYYNNITWTTGTESGGNCAGLGGTAAKAGFDAGDNYTMYTIPGSCSSDIITIGDRSNVGSAGKWIFRVDNSRIESPDGTTSFTYPPTAAGTSAVTSAPPPPSEHPCRCNKTNIYLDVVVVIDTSSSITATGLATIVTGFLLSLFSQLTISQDIRYTRVGVITYANNPGINATLTTYDDFMSLYHLLIQLPRDPPSGSVVNIAAALEAASTVLYGSGPLPNGTYSNGNRANAKDVVILIASDTGNAAAATAATRLKNFGATIITLAAHRGGGAGAEPDLSNVASPGLAFSAQSNDLFDNVTNALCQINCYCPPDWARFGSTAECVFPSEAVAVMSPIDFARTACQERSPLAFVADELSANKNFFLRTMAQNAGRDFYWTGLRYINNNYCWQQSANDPNICVQSGSYTNWATGFPNLSGGKNCIKSAKIFFTMQWQNEVCNQAYHYFCQFPACDTDNYCTEGQALGSSGKKKAKH